MFCTKCGASIPDGSTVCPNCKTNLVQGGVNQGVQGFVNGANNVFNQAEGQLGSAINDVRNSFNSGNKMDVPEYGGEKLKADRSLFMYIVLSIITCGLYGYYFVYKMAHDVNIACEGDGESTSGLVKFIVFSFLTCGIYSLIWEYGLANRLSSNAPRYGLSFPENGTSILMWTIFGALLCGIGPYIAMNILIKNTNKICNAYNRVHGL